MGLMGLVVNAARSDGLPLDRPILAASGDAAAACAVPVADVAEIDLAAAKALHQAGTPFVDARQASDYAVGHVPGALHLPSRGEAPDAAHVIAQLRASGTSVVVYDDDASCELARRLGERLLEAGLADVRLMTGGFSGWQRAGEPAQSGLCQACEAVAEGHP